MSFVLDASITIAWIAKEQRTPAIAAVFDHLVGETAWVPTLWWLEVANALQMGVRRQRYPVSERDGHLADLAKFTVLTDEQTHVNAWERTLALSDLHGLTVYDAAYLELALRRRLPLATLDRELRYAAAAEGVTLLGQ